MRADSSCMRTVTKGAFRHTVKRGLHSRQEDVLFLVWRYVLRGFLSVIKLLY